ncbi:hypothetical protein BDV96DRAFT_506217 [Lophiotrema nucula]|uniref:PHD-type domain-containing protein n=1 Tax=Lophiotrema nucula TaxID=690887 RepID=A0A6A5YL73_9PLEO|nr:hypothetical protein BDV96DRAFT_506217 [Lophiotrema nucula]
MSSINSLLNHEPASGHPQARPAQQQEPYLAKTTLHEAADALSTLATLGSGHQYVPSRELPSPTAFSHAPRRTSSFGSQHMAPVEPSPPIEQPQAHSPTLDQYHHGSKSPEEQRRQSLLISSSPAPVLAPIQSLTGALHDRINEESPQAATNYGADSLQSPIPVIKNEPSGTPREATPAILQTSERQNSVPGDNMDVETRKAIEATSKTPGAKATKKGSHAGTPAAESSPAPDTSSQAHASDDEGDSSEDSTLYCICRKPDNHKWMIGCDGGCDDWFHGSCVNMVQADEDLVDKFICPNCETNGKGNTTWKPMCRREGCRQPARLEKGKMSKYCSDECGVLFFQEQLQRAAGAKKLPATGKKSKKKGIKENGASEQLSDDDDEPTPLGGVLRAKDLKALALASNNIEAFKRLGSGVLSPPQTASPTRASFDGLSNGTTKPAEDLSLTPGEAGRLNALHTEKADLQDRLEVLKDREKFVSMAREQATRLAARENMKVKEFCGYDSRLSWSDAEFLRWRKGKTGQAAFKFGTLSPSAGQIVSIESAVNGVNGAQEEQEVVCLKKRCPKHPQWQKLNLQDARFEEMEIVEAIKECEKQERSVRDRARRRLAKDTMAAELVGANGDVKREEKNRDGWAEVVEA